MLTPNSSVNSCIDLQDLLDRVDNDRQLVVELFSMFKNDLPGSLQSLRDAVARGDLNKIVQLSHTLKGTLGNLAAGKASNSAATLERLARGADAAQLAAAVADFEGHANAILRELEAFLAEARRA
jgi:two-component system, sensor histidine kinase and response regulator